MVTATSNPAFGWPFGAATLAAVDSAVSFGAEAFDTAAVAVDLWQAVAAGPAGIQRRAERRLRALLAHAVAHAPFYRRQFAGIDTATAPLQALPTVDKARLMAAFDDWVTDPACCHDAVAAHLSDPARIGAPLAGRYAVWSSSGTSARPGWFIHDRHSLAVTHALFATRASPAAVGMQAALACGARFAFLVATEGHFAGITMWRRQLRAQPWRAAQSRAISALLPLARLREQLQAFAPQVLAGYPTLLALLADEQRSGRLKLHLRGVWSGGESLAAAQRAAIAQAFDCPVIDDYGASEFPNLAWDCGHGALHLNADWVILEPVDRAGRPVPPGVASHTVLLTVLANRVQPLIRYDLGDSVTQLAQPCACGSPLPALHVQGRRDDVVVLRAPGGGAVPLLPLALTTVIEEGAGVYRFQVVQVAPNRFVLRLGDEDGAAQGAAGANARQQTWHDAAAHFCRYCEELGVPGVDIVDDGVAPTPSAISGKLQRVCGLPDGGARGGPGATPV